MKEGPQFLSMFISFLYLLYYKQQLFSCRLVSCSPMISLTLWSWGAEIMSLSLMTLPVLCCPHSCYGLIRHHGTWPLIGHSMRLLIGGRMIILIILWLIRAAEHYTLHITHYTLHITHYSDHNYAQPGSDPSPPSLNSRNTILRLQMFLYSLETNVSFSFL